MVLQLELSFKWSFLLALENISQNISWDKEDHHIQKIQSSPAYHNALDAQAEIPEYYHPASSRTIVYDPIDRSREDDAGCCRLVIWL